MLARTLAVTFIISASLAFGQLDSNSVTVTASRSMSLQPDQVVFGVFVNSGVDATLDDVVAALQGSGIGIANFTGVSTPQFQLQFGTGQTPAPPLPTLQWAFGLPVAFSKMKDTVAALASLQASIPKKNTGLSLTFTVQGTQVSQQAQQSQTCSNADLLADARAQAKKLADAAGLIVGTILAVSSSTSSAVSISLTPGFSFSPFYSTSIPYFSPPCSMTVKFALGRF